MLLAHVRGSISGWKDIFYLRHPNDFQLWITQYEKDLALDYWRRDGDQLLHYHWEPGQEKLLWTLDGVQSNIYDLSWYTRSRDIDLNGQPDLSITREESGELETVYYNPVDTGFELLDDF